MFQGDDGRDSLVVRFHFKFRRLFAYAKMVWYRRDRKKNEKIVEGERRADTEDVGREEERKRDGDQNGADYDRRSNQVAEAGFWLLYRQKYQSAYFCKSLFIFFI